VKSDDERTGTPVTDAQRGGARGRVVPAEPHEPITAEQETELKRRYPDRYGERVRVAMWLARDVRACGALLEGRAVPPAWLNPKALARARRATYVQLVSPLDAVGFDELLVEAA
jgi:hypothetical protein